MTDVPASLDPACLESAPIPADWVVDGTPSARAAELARSPDGTCSAAHWDCTAGTFRWYFGIEETVHILEGEVTVRDAEGREYTLRAGDVAVMPANRWMTWRVDRYVRKMALCRYPVPRTLGRVLRRLQTWRNRRVLGNAGTGTLRPQPAAHATLRITLPLLFLQLACQFEPLA